MYILYKCTVFRHGITCAITVAPCVPGTASWNGLSPCKECKKGYYQPETGAQFCHKCDFGQTTHSIGSTRKQDCS